MIQEPTNTQLARAYGVTPLQIRRWKTRGLHVTDPGLLTDQLAGQKVPGGAFRRLSDPIERAKIVLAVSLLTPPTI